MITGSTGLVGGAVARRVKAAGWDLMNVPENLAVRGALEGGPKPDVIIHCAARLPTSYADENSGRINRLIDDEVLRFAEKTTTPVVYASTSAIGRADGPYVEEKSRTERLGRAASIPFTSLRITAPYGPLQRTRNVIKIFLEAAISGRKLTYHGTGSREQDFTFVDDIASAFICAIDRPGGTYCIASGSPVTMRDLAFLICDLVQISRTRVQPSGQCDPQEGLTAHYDTKDAETDLGWRAITSLRAGLGECLKSLQAG